MQPIPYTGRKSGITTEQEEHIKEKIKEECDITIEKTIEGEPKKSARARLIRN